MGSSKQFFTSYYTDSIEASADVVPVCTVGAFESVRAGRFTWAQLQAHRTRVESAVCRENKLGPKNLPVIDKGLQPALSLSVTVVVSEPE